MSEMPEQESSGNIQKWVQPQKGKCNDCGEVSELKFNQTHCECGGSFGRVWIDWPRDYD